MNALFRIFCLVSAFVLVCITSQALPLSSPNVLVVGDDVEQSHSSFLSALNLIHSNVTYKATTSDSISLIEDGEYLYSALILLSPRATLDKKLPLSDVLKFIDSGNSVFVTAGHHYSLYTSNLVEAIGVDLDSKGNLMRDHQNVVTDLDDGTHTYIRVGGMTKSSYLFGEAANCPSQVVFRGPGATLFNDNELVDGVIWGSPSSYSGDGKAVKRVPRAAGHGSVVAAALSTRVGGRVAYFGSVEALSNEAVEKVDGAHKHAMQSFLVWTVGAAGVLRVDDVRYECVDSSDAVQEECRVKDFVKFEMDVQVWELESKTWMPFVTDDMQLEFVMLNPWVRTTLHADKNGTFSARVPIPDQIGVYKLSVQYVRPGVSPVSMEHVVPVRPYLHNEYERFIAMASPYYVASFCMIGGVFVMGLVLLFGNESQRAKED